MKKLMILTSLLLFIGVTSACADEDQPINATQLPTKSQEFIKEWFPQESISSALANSSVTGKDYEVLLSNGTRIEFNKKGEWEEVDCRPNPVPAEIVPEAVAAFVAQHYPDVHIVQIERERGEYEVELSNRVSIDFDKNYNWEEVDGDYSAVPAAIIPEAIAAYVAQNYPNALIVSINRDNRDYEVELNNGFELVFDLNGKFIRMDD